MIKFLLSLFTPFRWFIEKSGADYQQFIRILELKLTLDDRRIKGFGTKPGKSTKNSLVRQSTTQIILGLLFITFLILIKSAFTFYYLSHTFTMVMMAMMIISEFSTVLFDTADNNIMQPLPIKGNTVSLARNAHIFLYLSLMAFNISVLTLLVAIYKFGLVSALIFFVTIFLNVLLTLFLTNILYLGIMRLASGEKLKNLLMYFQVFVAILFMAGYQFGINLVDKSKITDMVLPVHWYTYLFPPAFFSGFIEALSQLNFDTQHLIFIAETLILPVLAFYLTGKYLTPIFNQKLMELEQGDKASSKKKAMKTQGFWAQSMAFLFTKGFEERASFKLMWKMAGRERLFIQSLLPMFGYIIIMIVIPLFNKDFSYSKLVAGDKYLLILYVFILIAAVLPQAIKIGNNQHASWIFKTQPVGAPANLFKGSIKAVFVRFFLPFYVGLSLIIGFIWGIRALPDIIIALLAIYLITLVTQFIQAPVFPFTMERNVSEGTERVFKLLGILVIAMILGGLHKLLLYWSPYAPLILIPVYYGAILYIERIYIYKKVSWEKVDTVNSYS